MSATMTKRRKPGANASPEAIDAYIKHLQKERDGLVKATDGIDHEMKAIYDRLGKTLKHNGRGRQARSRNGVRENAGTGKILSIIKSLAKGRPPHVKTGDVAKEAQKRYHIKYPHSSFQSLQTAGVIKLATPSRGFITLLSK